MDGRLRARSAADGKVIWDFETLRDFDTVNGGMSGNVLVAFTR